jgi:hypothetical protein
MGVQSGKSPNFENFGTPICESRHKVYYKGGGVGFFQVWAVVSLVSSCLPVACSCTIVL